MFYIRFKDSPSDEYQQIILRPGPTTVEYPEKRMFTVKTTPDGAAVVTRPMRDGRPRRWIWNRYRPHLLTYEQQWKELEALEYRTRQQAGKVPTVEIWEDESTIGGFNGMLDPNTKQWTTVKFVRVERVIADGGGPVIYDQSFIEYLLQDDSYGDF